MPVANVGSIGGGVAAFEHATSDEASCTFAVMTADGAWQRPRTLVRAPFGHAKKVAPVRMRQVDKIVIETRKSLSYELDGGVRTKTDTLRVGLVPHAVSIRVVRRAAG